MYLSIVHSRTHNGQAMLIHGAKQTPYLMRTKASCDLLIPERVEAQMSLFGHWRQTLQTSGLFCVLQRSLWAAQPCKNIVLGARWTEGSSIRSASPWTAHWQGVRRCVHGSPAAQGLEEFFPKEDPIEEGENTGESLWFCMRSWTKHVSTNVHVNVQILWRCVIYMYAGCVASFQVVSGKLEN